VAERGGVPCPSLRGAANRRARRDVFVRDWSVTYHRGQSGEALIQRLERLAFTLEEEEDLSIVDVSGRVRAAFDVEKVTKRFFERFASEHKAFLRFIEGIRGIADREWYASLMLNRMMFIYFIQKRGFLDGDPDYLRHRLERLQKEHGKNKFQRFYRLFLLRLFHEGLGCRVVIIPGNHEYYRGVFEDDRDTLLATQASGVTALDRGEILVPLHGRSLRVLGATLWTDYAVLGDPKRAMLDAALSINDHRLIRRRGGSAFMPDDALAEHRLSRKWLARRPRGRSRRVRNRHRCR